MCAAESERPTPPPLSSVSGTGPLVVSRSGPCAPFNPEPSRLRDTNPRRLSCLSPCGRIRSRPRRPGHRRSRAEAASPVGPERRAVGNRPHRTRDRRPQTRVVVATTRHPRRSTTHEHAPVPWVRLRVDAGHSHRVAQYGRAFAHRQRRNAEVQTTDGDGRRLGERQRHDGRPGTGVQSHHRWADAPRYAAAARPVQGLRPGRHPDGDARSVHPPARGRHHATPRLEAL